MASKPIRICPPITSIGLLAKILYQRDDAILAILIAPFAIRFRPGTVCFR